MKLNAAPGTRTLDHTWCRLGDLALSAIFLYSGNRVVRDPAGPAAKLEAFTQRYLRSQHARSVDLVRLNAAVMLFAGGGLALGIQRRTAAALLALSLQPTNLVGHPFWQMENEQRASELTAFLSNIGITGGLVLATIHRR